VTKEELIIRLSDIEWEDFEVKKAKSEVPKSVWETVSAFSNTAGGWIIFGINQNGKNFEISGVENAEKIEQDFLNTLSGNKFNSTIRPLSKFYNIKGKHVLAFYIPLSKHKPVYFNNPANTFIRQGSSDRRAYNSEIDAMFRDQLYGTKTSETIENTSVNDLHKGSLARYRDYMARFNPNSTYNEITNEEFLKKTGVISNGKLSFAGLLMFGKRDTIDRLFPDFRIDLLEIPGKSYAEAEPRYTYRLEEQENLWEYYFTLFDRIKNKIDIPFQMSDEGFAMGNSEPLTALREALVNLLMHADYFSPAKPRIRIFTDRIEYFNPGGLPKPLEELLETDISLPRNPILAKLFRAVKLAENAGFGFDKMINGWKVYNPYKEVEFSSAIDYHTVTLYFEGSANNKLGEKLGERLGEKLGENQIKILNLMLSENSITISKLSETIGISTTAIENNIAKLKEMGMLRRVGSDKKGYWEVIK